MFYPSSFVTKITVICEKVLQSDLVNKNWLCKFFFDYITIKDQRTGVFYEEDGGGGIMSHPRLSRLVIMGRG